VNECVTKAAGIFCPEKDQFFLKKKILVFLLTVADFVNKWAAHIHCQVKEKCQDVSACSAVIVQSSDVTDIVQIAVFVRTVSEVFEQVL
jgi:hypothetical protein